MRPGPSPGAHKKPNEGLLGDRMKKYPRTVEKQERMCGNSEKKMQSKPGHTDMILIYKTKNYKCF